MIDYHENLEQLIQYMKNNKFEFIENTEDNIFFHKVYNDELYFVLLIHPHDGNNYHWLLRSDKADNHDRWANCDFEEEYLSTGHFKTSALKDLQLYFDGKYFDDEE